LDIVRDNQIEFLLILGDLTEEKDRHSAWLVTKVFEHIYRLSRLCKVIILRGNHDYLSPSTPFFGPLGKLSNVVWINSPTSYALPRMQALFLPHTNNHEEDWRDCGLADHKLIFTHNTFKGALSEHGKELDGISQSVFSKHQKVISGDVHVPQRLGPIEYVGSPYPIDFGDAGPRHMILLRSSRDWGYIAYEGPRKVTLDVDLTEGVDEQFSVREGDIVKVRVRVRADQDYGLFLEYKRAITEALQEAGCIVHMIQPIVERGAALVGESRVKKKSDEEILRAYAAAFGVRDSVLRTGLKLMRKT
jgi:DNA repair exonuclease SbcCD nuclease subunit